MNNLYISCPKDGISEDCYERMVSKMHKIAEIIFNQELRQLRPYYNYPNFYSRISTESKQIYITGVNIQLMASADYFIGVRCDEDIACNIESRIARGFHIPSTYVNIDDLIPIVDKREEPEKSEPFNKYGEEYDDYDY